MVVPLNSNKKINLQNIIIVGNTDENEVIYK
jgi:hypothetical protein